MTGTRYSSSIARLPPAGGQQITGFFENPVMVMIGVEFAVS